MASNPESKATWKVALLGVVIVAAVALIGVQIMNATAGSRKEAVGQATSDWVMEMAVKSEGDYDKLSPEEQKKLDEMTKGDGRRTLQMHPSAGQKQLQRQIQEAQSQTTSQ